MRYGRSASTCGQRWAGGFYQRIVRKCKSKWLYPQCCWTLCVASARWSPSTWTLRSARAAAPDTKSVFPFQQTNSNLLLLELLDAAWDLDWSYLESILAVLQVIYLDNLHYQSTLPAFSRTLSMSTAHMDMSLSITRTPRLLNWKHLPYSPSNYPHLNCKYTQVQCRICLMLNPIDFLLTPPLPLLPSWAVKSCFLEVSNQFFSGGYFSWILQLCGLLYYLLKF